MTPDQVNEVWNLLDRDYLAGVVRAGAKPVFAALSGAHGHDTKHAMHLIRLMRMGLEVLTSSELLVRRPDAEELVAIRDGVLSFDALLAKACDLEGRMEAAVKEASLPADVDRERVDALALELMRGA